MIKYLLLLTIIFCSSAYAANYIVYTKASYQSKPIAQITHLNHKKYVKFYKGEDDWYKVANVNNGVSGWINSKLPKIHKIKKSKKLTIFKNHHKNIYSKTSFINQYQKFMKRYKLNEISPYTYEYTDEINPNNFEIVVIGESHGYRK